MIDFLSMFVGSESSERFLSSVNGDHVIILQAENDFVSCERKQAKFVPACSMKVSPTAACVKRATFLNRYQLGDLAHGVEGGLGAG